MFISGLKTKYLVLLSIEVFTFTIFINSAYAFPKKHVALISQIIQFSLVTGDENSEINFLTCQGLILSSKYILTSEYCARSTIKKLQTFNIKVLNREQYEIGIITEVEKNLDKEFFYNREMLLGFTAYEGSEIETTGSNDELLESLSLYPYSVSYFDENKVLQFSSVDLGELIHKETSIGFLIPGTSEYYQGAPVFDQFGNLICIISDEGYCALPFLKTSYLTQHSRSKRNSKRDSLDCRMNENFKCTGFTLSQCDSQGGYGTCINEHSGKLCGVSFYKKGDSPPIILYADDLGACNSSDGCGLITCYKSDDSNIVECLAHWGWSSETFHVGGVQPSGCMEYHQVIKAGPVAGLVVGVFSFLVGCPTCIIASICAYMKLKHGRFAPYRAVNNLK